MYVRFFVPGDPKPKGSWRAMCSRTTGKPILKPSAKGMKGWVQAIQLAARKHYKREPVTGAVALRLAFKLRRRKTVKRLYPTAQKSEPDLDKLERAVLDALTGILYVDDAQVCDVQSSKRYPDPEIGEHGPGLYLSATTL
jgi:Holliday junction resolvase RusA-like endonuclease